MRHNSARTCSPRKFTVEYLLFSLIFAGLTLLLLFIAVYFDGGKFVSETDVLPDETTIQNDFCIVLDAGHGGEDGGAVGVNGVLEKTINLQIAEMLHDMLVLADIPVVMTRTEDKMLYDPNDDVKGRKKMLDLRTRLDIAEQTNGGILVSIHLNSFSQSKYHGLQVYYSANHSNSLSLAETIQNTARTYLQPQNDRQVKAAGSNIYLLHRIQKPAVLVECGFLSNPEECAQLSDDTYLRKLSTVLLHAIFAYHAQCTEGA